MILISFYAIDKIGNTAVKKDNDKNIFLVEEYIICARTLHSIIIIVSTLSRQRL